jgi:hypothetical protein
LSPSLQQDLEPVGALEKVFLVEMIAQGMRVTGTNLEWFPVAKISSAFSGSDYRLGYAFPR